MCVTLSVIDTKPYKLAAAVYEAIAACGRGPVTISYRNAILSLYYDGEYPRVRSAHSGAGWIIRIFGGGSHVSVDYLGYCDAYDIKLITTILNGLSKIRCNR